MTGNGQRVCHGIVIGTGSSLQYTTTCATPLHPASIFGPVYAICCHCTQSYTPLYQESENNVYPNNETQTPCMLTRRGQQSPVNPACLEEMTIVTTPICTSSLVIDLSPENQRNHLGSCNEEPVQDSNRGAEDNRAENNLDGYSPFPVEEAGVHRSGL